MTPKADSSSVWCVNGSGNLSYGGPSNSGMVRPVLELSKSANITMAS